MSGQLAVDIELTAARRAFAVGNVRLPGHLEFESQLVPPLGKRAGRLDVVQVPADVVVGVAKPAALNIE